MATAGLFDDVRPIPPPWMDAIQQAVQDGSAPTDPTIGSAAGTALVPPGGRAAVPIDPALIDLASQMDQQASGNNATDFLKGGSSLKITGEPDPVAIAAEDPFALDVRRGRAKAAWAITRREQDLRRGGQQIGDLRRQVRTLRQAVQAAPTGGALRDLERLANPDDHMSPLSNANREFKRLAEKQRRGDKLSRRERRRMGDLSITLAAADDARETLARSEQRRGQLDVTQGDLRAAQEDLDNVTAGAAADPLPTPNEVEGSIRAVGVLKQKIADEKRRRAEQKEMQTRQRETNAAYASQIKARESLAVQARRELTRANRELSEWEQTQTKGPGYAERRDAKRRDLGIDILTQRVRETESETKRDQEAMAGGYRPPVALNASEQQELDALVRRYPHVRANDVEAAYRRQRGLQGQAARGPARSPQDELAETRRQIAKIGNVVG